jgi:hypothetical protein
MTSFTFTYNGKECSGNYSPSTRGKGWIKVIFFDHSAVIVPTSLYTNKNKSVWVQNIQNGESVWPHELIQSMGESIELTRNNKFTEAETNNKYQ